MQGKTNNQSTLVRTLVVIIHPYVDTSSTASTIYLATVPKQLGQLQTANQLPTASQNATSGLIAALKYAPEHRQAVQDQYPKKERFSGKLDHDWTLNRKNFWCFASHMKFH